MTFKSVWLSLAANYFLSPFQQGEMQGKEEYSPQYTVKLEATAYITGYQNNILHSLNAFNIFFMILMTAEVTISVAVFFVTTLLTYYPFFCLHLFSLVVTAFLWL